MMMMMTVQVVAIVMIADGVLAAIVRTIVATAVTDVTTAMTDLIPMKGRVPSLLGGTPVESTRDRYRRLTDELTTWHSRVGAISTSFGATTTTPTGTTGTNPRPWATSRTSTLQEQTLTAPLSDDGQIYMRPDRGGLRQAQCCGWYHSPDTIRVRHHDSCLNHDPMGEEYD